MDLKLSEKFQVEAATPDHFTKDFECAVCLNIAWDPCFTPCHHLFCGTCLSKLTRCPLDQLEFRVERCTSLAQNPFAQRLLYRIKVICPLYAKDGCRWVGSYNEAGEHVLLRCEEHVIPCVNSGCTVLSKRKSIKKHVEECIWTKVPCDCCGLAVEKKNMSFHLEECPKRMIKCDGRGLGGCGLEIHYIHYQQHLSHDCLEAEIGCPFCMRSGVGSLSAAARVFKRKYLEQHFIETKGHVAQLLVLNQEKDLLIENLEKQLKVLREKKEYKVWKDEKVVPAEPAAALRKDLTSLKYRLFAGRPIDASVLMQQNELLPFACVEMTYQYNSENKIMFMTCNLMSGFTQRLERIRKNMLGALCVTGESEDHPPFNIRALWIVDSDNPVRMFQEESGDAEYYNWTVKDLTKEEDRALLRTYFLGDSFSPTEQILERRYYK